MPPGAIPYPFGDCRVCADRATGVHYGVATCEGCKGFFKRSIPKAEKYKCFYEGQCTLNPQERNRCKSCRFRRCLEVGMSVEGVKMGRIPKLEKEKALAELRKGLESKLDPQPMEDIHHKAAAHCSSKAPILKEKSSKWDLLEPHNQTLFSQPLLKPLPDKASGNRCSSSDSGIDDDGRDLSGKESASSDCVSERSDVGIFKESNFESVCSGVDNFGNDCNYLTHDPVEVVKESESHRVSIFSATGFVDSGHMMRSDSSNTSASGEFQAQTSGIDRTEALNSQSSVQHTPLIEADQTSTSFSLSDSDIFLPSKKIPLSSSASSSSSSHSSLPFYPTVIKELLNQIIETGHAKELQHNLVRHLLSASETSEWRPESWFLCLNKFRNCDNASEPKQNQQPLGNYSTQNLKRKAEDDVDDRASNSSLTDVKRGSYCDNEESLVSIPFSDSSKSLVSKLSKGDLESGLKNLSTYNAVQKEAKETVQQNLQEIPESSEFTGVTDENDDDCLQKTESNLTLNNSDLDRKCDLGSKIPSASCPDRFERLKKLEAMASRVPRLMFWDIPESTLGSLSVASPLPCAEAEQCKKEIEQVIEWLKMIGKQFTEKTRLDLAAWEEEAAGLRPVHPLNLLTELSQKDIGIYWEEVVACFPLCNFLILGLCSSIPGFNQLDKDDRAVLMEAAYFDVWLILLSSVFHDSDCFLRLVCEARFSRFWMQVFMPEKLINGIFHFVDELNSFNLTPCERIFLCAIQLTSKEYEKLKNPKKVHQLHDYYLDLLAYQLERTHQTNHSRILIKIFQLMPMLTSIGREQLELTSVLRVDQPPDVNSHMCTNSD